MSGSQHEIVEWQHRCHGMHVVGWMCRWCSSGQAVDYHYETQCRQDFCGADPVVGEVSQHRMSPAELRIELERIVSRTISGRSVNPPDCNAESHPPDDDV